MTALQVDGLVVRRGGRTVVDGVTFHAGGGEFIGLIGPNGAGKTTLFRAILGLQRHLGTSSLAALSPAERARTAAWMPQVREIAWPVPVETLIMLGRVPHLAAGARPGPADRAAVAGALRAMDLDGLGDRPATRLSGGEQARVLIARVLAQDTPVILADEPVAGLDPAHQITTMSRLADLARGGRCVVASLHDLGLAARHCTRLMLIDRGRLVDDGPPDRVLGPQNLREVFGVTAHVAQSEGGLIFQPLEVTR